MATPRVLCLHGFLQNAKIFSEKSSGLRKLLKKSNIQLDYIDGPVILKKEDLPFEIDDDKWKEIEDTQINKAWFYHFNESHKLDLTEAINTVVEHIKTNGPYDGIIGFSQGAALTAIIANTITQHPEANQPYFKFALTFSGYTFTEPSQIEGELQITEKFRSSFKVPTEDPDYQTKNIIVYGANDNSVPAVRSQYLANLYPDNEEKKVVFQHDGGHFVPNKKDFLKPIVDAIESALK